MRADREVTLFHSPQTRSTGALILLEELNADYRLHLLDLRGRQEHRQPAFLAINPMGKVPAIRHGDAVVTEQVAIFLYLADLYPEAGLAPPIGDPLRGPYLRWMAFYGSCFEPAIFELTRVDRAMKREAAPVSTSPYGDFDAVLATLLGQLAPGPYFLGARFTALDLLWGQGLAWILQFGLVPSSALLRDYVARIQARPAVVRALAKDSELAAALQSAAAAAAR
jgi:glutathione S-transferase